MTYSISQIKESSEKIAESLHADQGNHQKFLQDPVSYIESIDSNLLEGLAEKSKADLSDALKNCDKSKVPHAMLAADPNGAACWSCWVGFSIIITAVLVGAFVASGGSSEAIIAAIVEFGLPEAVAASIVASLGADAKLTIAGLTRVVCKAMPNTC